MMGPAGKAGQGGAKGGGAGSARGGRREMARGWSQTGDADSPSGMQKVLRRIGAGVRVMAGHLRQYRWPLAGLAFILMMVGTVALYSLHQSGFVIHARTEVVRVLAIRSNPNDGWRVDGARVCEDPPFTATEPQPVADCVAVLPTEPFFTPADGSAVTIRSLTPSRLEAVITPSPSAMGGASRLRSYADGSGERAFDGTVRITWDNSALQAPLVFLGEAYIGFAPESGNPGMTLGGTAAGYMAARGGAPRFEVSRAEIVPGDVMSPEMPGRRSIAGQALCRSLVLLRFVASENCEAPGPMHGVILWPAEDGARGFEVVYAGPAQRIRVDRLGTRFELAPDWTSRLRNDPLLLILSGTITLTLGIAGLVLALRKEGGG
ncbi:MAG: hypothetical protein R3D90_12590 [Paracoccaceae bacterium]